MKSVAFVLVICVIGIIVPGLTQAATDYCSKDLCQAGEQHIACKHSGGFSKNCHENSTIVDLNEKLQNLIIKIHNQLRNDIAGGKVKGYEPATRMGTMKWNNELAKMATLHSKQCLFDHDQCHSTVQFKHSGQNLAEISYSGGPTAYEDLIEELILDWYNEKDDASMDVIRKFPRNSNGKVFGHYTALVQQANTDCGCSFLKSFVIDEEAEDENDNVMDYNMMTCNYATTNIIDRPVYDAGKTASKCKTGTNPEFKNLCSTKEQYD